MKYVGVFCGSALGTEPAFANSAEEMGRLLAGRGWGLVYGGGNIGLMGLIADSVLSAGGEVIGVIPRSLVEREVAHQGLTTLHVVESMEQRKQAMIEQAHAYVTLPGGFGTLDEFLEVLTLSQLGYHDHPCGLLNVNGYYDPLLRQFEVSQDAGLLAPKYAARVIVRDDPGELLDALAVGPAQAGSTG